MTTRDRILDAAARIMRTDGVAGATTKEIAREAGFSEATLYKHFSDKADLFKGVLRERLPDLVTTLDRLSDRPGRGSVRDTLVEVATAALAFYADGFPMMAGLFAERSRLDEHVAGLRQTGGGPGAPNRQLAAYLRAEQRLGRVHADVDAEAAAMLLFGACLHHALTAAFADEPSAEHTITAERLVGTLLAGVAGGAGD
ncbi:TetR family transcriptional regulator [Haloactinopolyspora alba]|uniref:TetR family transcriptional regulator n=1 Tax=Haloactinopolyspora alba TaxID=648780 RepID=A0A2P8DYA3_9ACTN|nr:TetR/AcrR family transcriptional regulator [Haloactinopolyspora alba]PSL02194.1 TetR family transcriptional regulator [Haloactinopolyspora alba]